MMLTTDLQLLIFGMTHGFPTTKVMINLSFPSRADRATPQEEVVVDNLPKPKSLLPGTRRLLRIRSIAQTPRIKVASTNSTKTPLKVQTD
jgi:hypothetical protein